MDNFLSADEIRHFYSHVIDLMVVNPAPFLGGVISRKEANDMQTELVKMSNTLVTAFGGMMDAELTRMLTKAFCIMDVTERLSK